MDKQALIYATIFSLLGMNTRESLRSSPDA